MFVLVFTLIVAMSVVDKLIGMYATRKYDEWNEECAEKIRDQEGAEICFDHCPPGYFFTVFRFSSEFRHPFPVWIRNFKTYDIPTYCSTNIVMYGPRTPSP